VNIKDEGKYKLLRIRADKLIIHPLVQRGIVKAHLNRLAENLDLDALGLIHVVTYRGKLAVIDGQHRVLALLERGLGEWEVLAMHHLDISTVSMASSLSCKVNGEHVGWTIYDHFQQLLLQGDSIALEVQSECQKRGLKITRGHADSSVCAIKSLLRARGMGTLPDALDLLIAAYGAGTDGLEGKVIEGAALLFQTHKQIDRKALREHLAKETGGGARIIGDGRSFASLNGGSVARGVANAMIMIYNKGRRSLKLKPI
jgi:hypothetical protein